MMLTNMFSKLALLHIIGNKVLSPKIVLTLNYNESSRGK